MPLQTPGANASLLLHVGQSLPAPGKDTGSYEWRPPLQNFLSGKNRKKGARQAQGVWWWAWCPRGQGPNVASAQVSLLAWSVDTLFTVLCPPPDPTEVCVAWRTSRLIKGDVNSAMELPPITPETQETEVAYPHRKDGVPSTREDKERVSRGGLTRVVSHRNGCLSCGLGSVGS